MTDINSHTKSNEALNPCSDNAFLKKVHKMNDNKPAKLFTPQERERVKHKYTRRKVVWDCVLRQIDRGVSYNVVIDRIYQVYEQNQTVTKIVNQMRKDKLNNRLHVSLA